jgi:hypothetical protein
LFLINLSDIPYAWGEILNLPNPSDRTRPWGSLRASNRNEYRKHKK